MALTWIIVSSFFLLLGVMSSSALGTPDMVKIRGHHKLQQLPASLTKTWNTWTLDKGELVKVPTVASDSEDWVDPVSYESLYLPEDLPVPRCRPAIALGVANGAARYVMPSVILSLNTPSQLWRNRGVCSLPRASAWLDLFSEFAPRLADLRYSCFGLNGQKVRFLEDQDGGTAWVDLLNPTLSSFGGEGSTELPIANIVSYFQAFLLSEAGLPLTEGYHFVDIPLPEVSKMPLPQKELHAYITDLRDPRRLLELEDPSLLDLEPCGELSVQMMPVAPGGSSLYLPEVRH